MIALAVLLVVLAILVYLRVIKSLSYWKNRGVVTSNIIPLFGDDFRVVFGLESFVDQTYRMYKAFPNERFYGTYQFTSPVLVLRSPDVIKKMCVKDFDHFLNRRTLATEGPDVLFKKNLLNLKGQRWKDMRSAISPTFTSSKMKALFLLVWHNAKLFTDYFLEKRDDSTEVEMKDAVSRFTNDVIANAVFGIQVDSLKERDNLFFRMSREGINIGSIRLKVAFCLGLLSPTIAKIFQVPIFPEKFQHFIKNVVKDTLNMREKENIKRPDVIGLLLEVRKCQLISKDQEKGIEGFSAVEEHLEMKTLDYELSDADIAAQAFLFFLAGFEGVANLLCFIAYELAINPDVQRRLVEEIEENWPADDKPSYSGVMNLTYLDMVVSETLRKWPNGLTTDRVVTKKYTIEPEQPGEEPLTLEEGTTILIPILGIHHDPKYYPNPEKFDPERFSPENRHKIVPYTYIPFGVGPRNCLGNRFALMEVKTLVFYLLHHFEIVPTEKTQIPLKLNKNALGFVPENGIHVGLKRRI